MALLASQVVFDVRLNLQDDKEPYYHTDDDLLRFLTDASYQLAGDRPDLLLTTAGTLSVPVDITALIDTLIYEADMKEALVNYTCYLALFVDGEDTQNIGLSQAHKAAYKQSIS